MQKTQKVCAVLLLMAGILSPFQHTVFAETVGGFVVSGGRYGTDYTYSSGELRILTGTTLTIQNANPSVATADRITVPAGVEAEVVFDGVNIKTNQNSPFTLTPDAGGNGAKARIILADGSKNKLVCGDAKYAGLRAGQTTTLTIDDSVLNEDTAGNAITPANGRVPYDVTLSNGTVLHKGDRLTLLDSRNPGELHVICGSYGASIGGSDTENGGTMIFNGGIINADASSGSYGAGIGGGGRAAGGNIIINGGKITSRGGYHGAGVGGGYWSSASSSLDPAAVEPNTGDGYSGNITINGGLTYSYGGAHGSAFGDGCVYPTGPLGYKIIVTGGTILPYLTQTNSWTSDLSALGGDVFVTGGSLKANSFQSAGKSVAYGDFEKKTEVFMTTVSLSYLGIDKVKTTLVDDFKLLIGGKKTEYGSPSYTDDQGILYLWLPSDSKGKEVAVDTSVYDQTTGKVIHPEKFFITKVENNSQLKMYHRFTIDDNYHDLLSKRYDGLPFDSSVSKKFLKNIVDKGGIPVTNPSNGVLNDLTHMSVTSQRLDDVTLEPDTSYETGSLDSQRDAGKYELIITSTQYAELPVFKDSYWGHRGYYKYAEIFKADTETTLSASKTSAVKPADLVTYKVKVSPASYEGTECAAPKGYVQFYVDGIKCGKPVKLTENNSKKEGNHFVSTVEVEFSLKDTGVPLLGSENKVISVEYIGEDGNYNAGSKAEVTLQVDLVDLDIDGDGKPDINIDTDGDGKPDIDIDTDGDGKPDINIDTDGDKKPDINIDTDGDKTPDINIDTDGDKKPDINIDTDGDKKPDINIDTNGDKKPDINIDTDGDKKPDINIDTDGDKKPDINIDTDGDKKPDINIDTDGDKKPDINIDTDGDKKPDINIDTNGDKKPDINIDTNGDRKPDINIDTDGDKKPDINIDTDKDGKPDIDIDIDGDGKPDINIDTDKDGRPDINIDTDGDGRPDINIDTDDSGKWKPSSSGGNADGIWKPDTHIDTDGDGKGDKDYHTDPVDQNKDGVDDNWKPDIIVNIGGLEYDTADPGIPSDDAEENGPVINLPQTGDNGHTGMWLVLNVVSLFGGAAILLSRKKKEFSK